MNREQRLCTLVLEIQMNEAKEYLQRGRRFERLPPEELSDQWLAAYNGWANGDPEAERETFDFDAELWLRGLKPPTERAKDAFARLDERFDALTPAIKQSMDDQLERELDDLHKSSRH